MTFLHQSICISPQNTYPEADFSQWKASNNNLLEVIEPAYPGIPAGTRRRMGKSVRMAVGAALPLLENVKQPDGIVIGTANGGMEDCIKFLNQIIEFNEGLLTPGNFVQSTSNASAAQIALITKNHKYNITHVHRGLAFENAMMDIVMLLKENAHSGYLLGCVDEISAYNFNIDRLAGWYREETVQNKDLFIGSFNGSIVGEGAYMVLVNNDMENADAKLAAVKTLHSVHVDEVSESLSKFISENIKEEESIDLLITGENGDIRLTPYYEQIESLFPESIPVARYKHLCGEYFTSSSFACWLSTEIFKNKQFPPDILKKGKVIKPIRRILIYNNFRGLQHAFILLEDVNPH